MQYIGIRIQYKWYNAAHRTWNLQSIRLSFLIRQHCTASQRSSRRRKLLTDTESKNQNDFYEHLHESNAMSMNAGSKEFVSLDTNIFTVDWKLILFRIGLQRNIHDFWKDRTACHRIRVLHLTSQMDISIFYVDTMQNLQRSLQKICWNRGRVSRSHPVFGKP